MPRHVNSAFMFQCYALSLNIGHTEQAEIYLDLAIKLHREEIIRPFTDSIRTFSIAFMISLYFVGLMGYLFL